MVNRLETLRQGKKTAEELNTEFLQIVGQAGMDRKTLSDHLHLIGYYRKTLEPRLSHRILFSNDIPKTMDGWATYSLTRIKKGTHQNRKQTPTKAIKTHVGGE
jgi:hypothetical protein